MLFYTHLVWTLGFDSFFGANAWLTPETIAALPGHSSVKWSHFYWIASPALLWTVHFAALAVFALLTVGLFSRTMSVLAFLLTVSYINRASLAQFGLDDTNAMLALYLMVGPSGAAFSVDRWLKRRRASITAVVEQIVVEQRVPVEHSIGANVAIRLIQVHMCVIYLFSGISKLQGPAWWDGRAILLALTNLEYQSFDQTWLAKYPWLVALLTHITVFWETFYCALIWPRLTRPIILAIAAAVHLGIGAFLGMWTFGLAMLIGNAAFISPWVIRRVLDRPSREQDMATASEVTATSTNLPPKSRRQYLERAGR